MRGWRRRGTTRQARRPRIGWAATLVLAFVGVPPEAALARPRNVLVLDHGPPGRPLSIELHAAFRAALVETTGSSVSIYEEALDLERFPGEAYVVALRRFLGGKYRERPPDVIAAQGDPALRFVLEWRDPPWPAAAVALVTPSEATARTAHEAVGAAGVIARADVETTLSAALALSPTRKRS